MSDANQIHLSLFDGANVAILIIDSDSKFVDSNKVASVMLGRPQNEILGKNPQDPDFSPKYQPCGELSTELAQKYISKVIQGEDLCFEWLHLKKDGTELPVEVSLFNFGSNNKTKFLITWKDLTAIKQKEKKLIESEKKFRTIFEKSTDGTILLPKKLDGKITECNEAAYKLLGYNSKMDLIGKTLLDISPEVQPNGMPSKDFAIKNEEELIKTGQVRFEWVHLKKDKSPVWLDIVITIIQGEREKQDYFCRWRDITESKKNEESLIKTQKLINESQLIAGMGSWEYDLSTNLVQWSESTYKLYGVEKNEDTIAFSELLKLIHIDDRERVKRQLKDTLARGYAKNIEYRIVRPDGEIRDMFIWAEFAHDKLGKPQKIIGVIQDITEKKRAEKKNKLQEKHLRSLLEIPVGYVIYRTRLNPDIGAIEVVQVSTSYVEILGISEEAINNFQRWFTYVHPEDLPHLMKANEEGMKPPFKLSTEIRYNHPKKGWRWLNVRSTGIPFDNNPNLIEYANGLILDVTERKEAEEKLKESEKQLNEAQEMSKIGSWEQDLVNNKLQWSDEAYRIFNCNPQSFTPTKKMFFEFVHPQDRKVVEETYKKHLVTKEPYNLVHRILLPDNEIKYVQERCITYFDSNGIALRSKGTIADITEQVKYQQELVKAKEKAEESDKLKTAFLQNMSHEIRTPMNGILGFANLLKEPDLTGKEQKKYIKIIEQSGIRMLNIISDLIDISKIETGQIELAEKDFDLNKLLDDLLVFFKPEAEKKGLRIGLKSDIKKSENIIIADKTKLTQILTNLIGNALKFTKKGQINFGYSLKNSQLQFFVKDTGIGISADFNEKIFERFIQEDTGPLNILEGSGLGLSISKAYIEKMGGNIWVESEPGMGATFYFNLPYKWPKRESKEQSIDNPVFFGVPTKLKILIAEDDNTSYIFLNKILSKNNIQVLHARNGKEAIEFCETNTDINLVLMDIRMPVLNGLDAIKQIKIIDPSLPIIAQSAYITARDKKIAYEAGCDDYLEKPIDKDLLYSIIQDYAKKSIVSD